MFSEKGDEKVTTDFSKIAIDESFMGAQGTMDVKDTEKTYHLTAKVVIKEITQVNNGTKYVFKKVYLMPIASGELVKFYDTYLPEYIAEGAEDDPSVELVFIGIPMSKPFRAYLSKGDRLVHEKHIGLMTTELNDTFKLFEGKNIRIDCLALSEHESYDV